MLRVEPSPYAPIRGNLRVCVETTQRHINKLLKRPVAGSSPLSAQLALSKSIRGLGSAALFTRSPSTKTPRDFRQTLSATRRLSARFALVANKQPSYTGNAISAAVFGLQGSLHPRPRQKFSSFGKPPFSASRLDATSRQANRHSHAARAPHVRNSRAFLAETGFVSNFHR